ncbi:hypothetical protein [Streptomyces sioyaensis]|uniref:hypothetical protein n=1 Tax=Streptomyces sioyaensis TaxID=67364 RepID=UPI003791A45C
MRPTLLAFALALLAWLLVVGKELQQRRPEWHWYLTGYPPLCPLGRPAASGQ